MNPLSQIGDQAFAPKNDTDALSYFHAVKAQFVDRPEVYNQFLDIMKDSKSQNIDIPDLIRRVLGLFDGDQELVQGFNTFLPVGYHIDVFADPLDPNIITVTTPEGTTTLQNTLFVKNRSAKNTQTLPPPGHSNPNAYRAPMAPIITIPSAHGDSVSRSHATVVQGSFSPNALPGAPPNQLQPHQLCQQQNAQVTDATASFLGNLLKRRRPPNSTRADKGGHEFNKAMRFLNTIKARYNDDPDTYKQFLDILQTYKKERATAALQTQVYLETRHLFKDAPDIFDDFQTFLGEVGGPQDRTIKRKKRIEWLPTSVTQQRFPSSPSAHDPTEPRRSPSYVPYLRSQSPQLPPTNLDNPGGL